MPARLSGYRRAWNVAMDNSATLPGYKIYRRPDGSRPAVFVTFLNIVPDVGGAVNGMLLPVGADDLRALDERERNYDRVEVSDHVPDAPGRVWTYVGKRVAVERFERGLREQRAVVSAEYHDGLLRQFAALEALDEFHASTEPPPCPIVELERVAVP